IFFERPAWDRFHGAHRTFAADALNPDGRVVQQPSTHLLKQDFAKVFDVKFKDKDGKDKFVWITCYGPAMSRIFASVVSVHGDDKGLRFPWEIAPRHVAIVPIDNSKELVDKAKELKEKIGDFAEVVIDSSNKTPGEKFNHWEMKGIPVRIDLGKKELKEKKLCVFRRDLNKKEFIAEKELMSYLEKVKNECGKNLLKEADQIFKDRIVNVSNVREMKKAVGAGNIVRCEFCSIDRDGERCAEVIEKEVGVKVRGTNLKKEAVKGKCVVCGKKAGNVVYVARDY
ncbi:MAG: hypothetical protein KKD18_01720, partial [Nanoarchaeota archaeon]|nr:hypothetical protein [Nanoarchaeota archaeon]